MSHQQLTHVAPVDPVIPEAKPAIEAPCDTRALKKVRAAFAERTPIAILVDDGNRRAHQVLDHFLVAPGESADVVRVTEPFLDSLTFMRHVIVALGFQPTDLSLADMESILRMFLSYQKTHSQRTIICVEEAQDQGAWVLDKMCQFVALEEENEFGLLIVLSGRRNMVGALAEPPLDSLTGADRVIVTVAPPALQDTREVVRQCVESDGQVDVGQVFDFRAITRIHKLSAGVPDTIGTLCGECVHMLDKEDETLVTAGIVNKAARSLGLHDSSQGGEYGLSDDEAGGSGATGDSSGQLIVRRNGRVVQTLMVDKESLLIGRDKHCDICLTSPVVSRQHALIINAPAGVKLVDLGSTNGSVVNGERVERCSLQENEVIVIGDTRIEFVAADYGPIAFETGPAPTQSTGDDSVFAPDEVDEGTRIMAVERGNAS